MLDGAVRFREVWVRVFDDIHDFGDRLKFAIHEGGSVDKVPNGLEGGGVRPGKNVVFISSRAGVGMVILLVAGVTGRHVVV